jgi:carbon monoxide dehydrogenase subunit G
MATLHKQIWIEAPCERVWDAARDIGALHTRLVPGFVTNTELDGEVRIVTFANGMTMREPIISLDDQRHRLAWAAVGGATTHYNAVLEVHPEGNGTRVSWTSDFLPHSVAATISAMQDQGLAAMRRAFERPVPKAAQLRAP